LKNKLKFCFLSILMIAMLVMGNAQAEDFNIPITADRAFDAYANQTDPLTGESARVAIVDVRTTAEYFWVGTTAQVDSIVTKSGKEFLPHNGKVKMRLGSRFLKFKVEKGERLRPVFLPVSRVDSIVTAPIAYHVPLKIWDEASASLITNDDFAGQMDALAFNVERGTGFDVVILMCRSGKRSNTRTFATENFAAVYEIDQPDGTDGRGGFEGTNYHSVFNGYRGFPGRNTFNQESPSVSWADTGLPIHIGGRPTSPMSE
jgi:Na+-transporting methylmalonyl-CoA/oxaloacetate decarboxylase gamma subunit